MTSTYSVRAARVETLGRRARSIVAKAKALARILWVRRLDFSARAESMRFLIISSSHR